jgi:hypothetical protein
MLLIPRLVNARKIEPIVRRVDEPLFDRITLELYCLRLRRRRQGDADDQRIPLAALEHLQAGIDATSVEDVRNVTRAQHVVLAIAWLTMST